MGGGDNLIKLTFEEVLYKHTKLVEKLVWLLRNSETEDADFPLDKISWFYSFVLKKDEIKEFYGEILKMKTEDRLLEELNHVDVSLVMVTSKFSILVRLSEIPIEIKDFYRKIVIQRMYLEKFFQIGSNMDISYSAKMDIWDDKEFELSIDELKNKLQEAIETENYEEAAKIQKQIDKK